MLTNLFFNSMMKESWQTFMMARAMTIYIIFLKRIIIKALLAALLKKMKTTTSLTAILILIIWVPSQVECLNRFTNFKIQLQFPTSDKTFQTRSLTAQFNSNQKAATLLVLWLCRWIITIKLLICHHLQVVNLTTPIKYHFSKTTKKVNMMT